MIQVVENQPHLEDRASVPNSAGIAQQVAANLPPSATTPQMSVTGNRDYGMKFVAGVEDITSNPYMTDSQSNGTASEPTPSEIVTTAHEPPPYLERPRNGMDKQDDEDNDDSCHPFWVSWWDIVRGLGLLLAASLTIPLVMIHGISKMFYYVPVLYKDETIRKWPDITGLATGCVAGVEWAFWFVFVSPLTDWLILPYKGARKEGVLGFFKGLTKGLCNIIFKPVSGAAGLLGHPMFGIYKEATKFKLIIKRQRRSRKRATSPV
ncbi:hypothetical protein F5X99DRAFT_428364 [Biscogniauxia marginata]|nr:hypothetical protein F5X99DRAFT_428364 [Biscogniauxia marginata]